MATTFLHALGSTGFTSASGYIITPFNLITAELGGLANGSTGSSLVTFDQTNFGQAQRGVIWLTVATNSWIVAPGANISGWWLHAANSTTVLEASNATNAPARPPDWIIPLMPNTAVVGSTYFAVGVPSLPYDTCKVMVQNNNASATVGSGNQTITVAPLGDQY